MEFPFGHPNHHHQHHRRDDGEDEFPPPGRRPPSSSYYDQNDPPPPQVSHVFHTSHVGGPGPPPPPNPMDDPYGRSHFPPPPPNPMEEDDYGRNRNRYPPPPQMEDNYGRSNYPDNYDRDNYPRPPVEDTYADNYNRPPPPPVSDYYDAPPPNSGYSSVEHVSHDTESESANRHHGHSFQPHVPSFFHHQSSIPDLSNKPSFRIYTKAETNFSLTIRDGKVILAPSDPSDPFQHWFKDEKYSIRVKDEEGFPSFAMVNKASGHAIKHSIGATHPVQIIPYNPNVLDESVLWTESRDLGDGYRAVRMVNNICLNVDAFNGDKDHGGVRNGTTIVLWEWAKGDNQRWRIVPY